MIHDHAWNGFWLFPMIMFAIIIIFMFFGRRGCRSPRWYSDRYPREDEGAESALDILNKRYAKGEISKEKYEEMKKDIQSVSTPDTPAT